ncbi:MAG: carbamoyl-phosphate synthase large subunit [Desulfosarcina sp.]
MPIHPPLQKILIIGAGPIRIGLTGALDAAACRACEASRKAGLETVMAHCDPSAMSADVETADRTYMVPLTVEALTEIILREKPDALLPTVGGPAALSLAKALSNNGLLDDHAVRLLGVSKKTLAWVDDPTTFFEAVDQLGLAAPVGQSTGNLAEAAAIAEGIGYPVFVRTAESSGRVRHGIAYNVEELRAIATGGRLPSDVTGRFRIEPALSGHREIEVALLRDGHNHMRITGMAENLDPVGIHSGDSVVVIPPATIAPSIRRQIEAAAFKLAEAAEVVGAVHIKVAVAPDTNRVLVIAMDPRFTRMTALLTRAFGVDLPDIHAGLSLGQDLNHALEVEKDWTADDAAAGTWVVRLPRWEFERFPGEAIRLDARMKSSGEILGLGRNFAEALQRAVRCRSPRHPILGLQPEPTPLSAEAVMRRLVVPSPDRLDLIHEALKKKVAPESLATVTGIEVHWIHQLAQLSDLETQLAGCTEENPPTALLEDAVRAGFSEAGLSLLLGIPEQKVAGLLTDAGITFKPHPAGDADRSRIWFHTADPGLTPHSPVAKTVLIVGPGPGCIGQSIELDHCCVHAAKALRDAGRRSILINANLASACGLNDFERTYVEPMTASDIQAVCRSERPEGILLQFGGQGAMDLGRELEAAGFTILGTGHPSTVLSQDRLGLSALLTRLGIPHPQLSLADTSDQAMDMAESIGYPLWVRCPSDRREKWPTLVTDARMMEQVVIDATISSHAPIMLEQFLEYAIEVEADALCDGKEIHIPAIMEHIELAGVHSGDSAMVTPPYSTPPRHVDTIAAMVHKIALELDVKGLLNTRFAVYNDTVYLLEVRPWACRTLPLVSKITNVPMAKLAVEIMLGTTLEEMNLPRRLLPHYGIRSSVFPFDTFAESDPLMGPCMRSTGQALILADAFGMAYFTSQEAAGPRLPLSGNVLITVTDADKPSILEPARLFTEMGFGILATRGTHVFLKKNGLDAQLVKKLGFGRPDLMDAIKTGDVALVVNTPSGSQSQQDDAYIRKTAIRYHIPNVTTPAAALAAAKGIAARKRGQDSLCTLQSYVGRLR